jgi:hypothetical protein
MQNLQATVHIHLRRDGSILVLGQNEPGFHWFPLTLTRLESTLAAAKTQGAVIEYSRDDPESDPPKPVELIYKIIVSYEIPIKLLKEPPFRLP